MHTVRLQISTKYTEYIRFHLIYLFYIGYSNISGPQSLVSRHRALSVTKLVDPRALVEAQQEAASKTTLDTGTVRVPLNY